jgi:hypothetical protein
MIGGLDVKELFLLGVVTLLFTVFLSGGVFWITRVLEVVK